jgi:aminoglycoside phosphotransferase (APT) family kinase protein
VTPDQTDALGRWLGGVFGSPCKVTAQKPLTGGAIQENWLLEVMTPQGRRELVLRKDAPATIAASHSRAHEFALLQAAKAAGIMVPDPLAYCADASIIGAPFALMAKVEGVGFGPRIVKDASLGGDREKLVADIGAELARIHAIRPPKAGLAFLGDPPANPVAADIAWLRASLDAMGLHRPALEWGLRYCERHLQPSPRLTLVHRDLRTGNYMVDDNGLTAILDWEFASWGDPISDLGWFCAACWRFGHNELEAGGVGSRATFYAGYEAANGTRIDDAQVRLWEIMAHLRWAVIALQQGARHLSGKQDSLALALTSRIVPELEMTVLRAAAPASSLGAAASLVSINAPQAGEAAGTNLLATAGKLLADTLLPKLTGEDRAAALMIASAMRMASRELAARELASRELASSQPHEKPPSSALAELVASIREGQRDHDAASHHSLLVSAVRAVSLTRPEFLLPSEAALISS